MEKRNEKLYEFSLENNIKRIKRLENKHKGERCFIIGTGPSLKETSLNLIKDEVLFGVNTLYNGFRKYNIYPQYYAVGDPLTFRENYREILPLNTTLFIGDGALDIYLKDYSYYAQLSKRKPLAVRMLGLMWHTQKFSTDMVDGAYNGDTVVIDIPLQMCYYMGFSEVYLVGIDLDYSGDHHFDGTVEMPQIPFPSHLGDFTAIKESFQICKKYYENDGRKIINSTNGGKLEIFPRKSLEEIFNV